MTPDVNVLVSAYRPDHPHHLPARLWLDETVRQAANGRASFVLLSMRCPGAQFQSHSATWPHLQKLFLTQRVRGHLVSDAWIAATVMQSGETLCTFDRDFARLVPNNQLILLKP